ncbi:hypothetical protein PoB_005413100 [Plakobranchus ocellatus]|uniref:Uncharacterized protein n=1 Tax=Plakobranchus ocellatus TaxID=259542 RepID=A0AAV4BWR4_9GAST|nr:hypothetical protein PoB_005413100 [Plakobranchus ocellatus]
MNDQVFFPSIIERHKLTSIWTRTGALNMNQGPTVDKSITFNKINKARSKKTPKAMASENFSTKDELKDQNDWRVEEPEEAKYNFSDEKGLWQPKPEDILNLFEKLADGNALPLKWKCPGRRAPKSKEEVAEENQKEGMELEKDEEMEEKSVAPEVSAFDFDEFHSEANTKLTPIRAPGGTGRTPRTKKRARMDNIMDSLRRQRLQNVAEREARRARGSPSGTPKSRPPASLKTSDGKPVSTSPNVTSAPSSLPAIATLPAVPEPAPVLAITTAADISAVTTSTHLSIQMTTVAPLTTCASTSQTTLADASPVSAPFAASANRNFQHSVTSSSSNVVQITSSADSGSSTQTVPSTSIPQQHQTPAAAAINIPSTSHSSSSHFMETPINTSSVSSVTAAPQKTLLSTDSHQSASFSTASSTVLPPSLADASVLLNTQSAESEKLNPPTAITRFKPAEKIDSLMSSSIQEPICEPKQPSVTTAAVVSAIAETTAATAAALVTASATALTPATTAATSTAATETSEAPPPSVASLPQISLADSTFVSISSTSTSISPAIAPAEITTPANTTANAMAVSSSEPAQSTPTSSSTGAEPATAVASIPLPAKEPSKADADDAKAPHPPAKDNSVEAEIKSLNLQEKS